MAFGATRTATPGSLAGDVKSITADRGVDAVLELTGSSDATAAALPLLRMGGTMVLAGAVFPTPAVALLPEQVVRRQLSLRGVHNYQSRDLKAALAFLRDHPHYPFASLVSDWMPLEDADRGFRLAHENGAFRIGVRPGRAT
jgi:alcohol dehydrogenase